MKQERLVPISVIPSTLWSVPDQHICIPPSLKSAYSEIINERGLQELSKNRDRKNPPVGGIRQEDADKHFAQAFDGSLARAILAILDPKHELNKTSDDLIKLFSGGKVTFVDLPCGACATLFGFLSTIFELRKHNVVPRNRLSIDVLAGDISGPAKVYASDLYQKLKGILESESIFVDIKFEHWNVLDKHSNRALTSKILAAQVKNQQHLMIVSNFNGFLMKEEKFDEAMIQIEEMFEYGSQKGFRVIWIEQHKNSAISAGGLFTRLIKAVNKWKRFAHYVALESLEAKHLQSETKFMDPLYEDVIHRVRIALLHFSLRSKR